MPDYTLERPVINGKRTLVWYVCWSENRRSRRRSTCQTDKVAAERFRQQFAALQDAPPETVTVGDLCDAYLKVKEADPNVAYPKAIRNSLNHIKAAMGALPPSMISRATIRSYTAQRRKLVQDPTISKELRFLRQALKFGVAEKWIPRDDEPKIELPGEGQARERFLTREEFARLYFHASPLHLRVFLALAISTAQRGKHILALTWDRVDFDGGFVRYKPADPRSKKRTAQIPMNDALRGVLTRAYEARSCAQVIEWNGKPVKSVRKAYERAARLAGLSDAHRHDLRRTAASWAVQDGHSFDEVATMLGDSVEITRKHYAMFAPDYLRGVVNSIGGMRA
jgi:integrase